jgi:NAD(P)-dependent dehydrogenase (short-subunit alcohol dehydrogenase family)
MRFDNTVTLITGAGSGIGRASAERLAREGGAVVCLDINEDAAAETAAIIANASGRALGLAGDVALRGDLEAARDAARAWSPCTACGTSGLRTGTGCSTSI